LKKIEFGIGEKRLTLKFASNRRCCDVASLLKFNHLKDGIDKIPFDEFLANENLENQVKVYSEIFEENFSKDDLDFMNEDTHVKVLSTFFMARRMSNVEIYVNGKPSGSITQVATEDNPQKSILPTSQSTQQAGGI
jgi:hypothetical protein